MLQELLKAWLVPPALNAAILLTGLMLYRLHKGMAKFLIITSLLTLFIFSSDYVASLLERSIQVHPALDLNDLPTTDPLTIIVAGSAHHKVADEYGYPTPTSVALERLHYASYLHRKTGHPVLLTGGVMNENQVHADVLATSFINEYKTEARWREGNSRSTQQNAEFSAEILMPLGRKSILLVTHSYHMKRSAALFEQAGFEVIPAPIVMSREPNIKDWRNWVPSASGLLRSSNVIYEYFGLLRDWIAAKSEQRDFQASSKVNPEEAG